MREALRELEDPILYICDADYVSGIMAVTSIPIELIDHLV
jgi:hypothetical protein